MLLDGVDVRDVTLRSVRRQVGTVPQEAFLFGGSIRDNVSFARPDASEAEVLEACRLVGLGDLIDRLPDGIDTPVHERGVSLSSGERQLLALARAFLARPRILVLDEATSNLDLQVRGEDRARPRRAARGPHRDPHRPPPRHRHARRSHRRRPRRRDRRARHPRTSSSTSGGRYAAMVETWDRHQV